MNKVNLRSQQLLSTLLFITLIGLLGWLSVQYKMEFDWTGNSRNSLTPASIKQLQSMKDPVKIIAFAPNGAEFRADTIQFFNRYIAAKSNVELEFIDPSKNPDKLRAYEVQAVGDMVIEYQGRREILRGEDMNEAPITLALQRLTFAQERWVVFLQGHGEHELMGEGASGLRGFESLLKSNGLKTRVLNLATSPSVPDNTATLVVAGPSSPLLDGEEKVLLEYLARGGNILWLSDPDAPPPPAALSAALGIVFENGTAIFPDFAALSGDPSMFITDKYPPTPVTEGLVENSVYPLARTLRMDMQAKPQPAWKPQPFLQSGQNAWLEAGALTGEIAFDPGKGDRPGPLTLGVLLTRTLPAPIGRAQRVAMVGDSDFLTNTFLGQAGNAKIGLNLVRWLVSRDDQLNITVPEAQDQALDLSPTMGLMIQIGFLIVMPLLLLIAGILRWAIRRRV